MEDPIMLWRAFERSGDPEIYLQYRRVASDLSIANLRRSHVYQNRGDRHGSLTLIKIIFTVNSNSKVRSPHKHGIVEVPELRVCCVWDTIRFFLKAFTKTEVLP